MLTGNVYFRKCTGEVFHVVLSSTNESLDFFMGFVNPSCLHCDWMVDMCIICSTSFYRTWTLSYLLKTSHLHIPLHPHPPPLY